MSYRVYEFRAPDRARLHEELSYEPLYRLALTWREARHFGIERETLFVLLEGDEEALRVADTVLLQFGRRPPKWEDVARVLRAEDTQSAVALGAVFGEVTPPPERPRGPTPEEEAASPVAARLRRATAPVRSGVEHARDWYGTAIDWLKDCLPTPPADAARWKVWRWRKPLIVPRVRRWRAEQRARDEARMREMEEAAKRVAARPPAPAKKRAPAKPGPKPGPKPGAKRPPQ